MFCIQFSVVSFHKYDKIFASDLYGLYNGHTDLPVIFYIVHNLFFFWKAQNRDLVVTKGTINT